MMPVMVKEADLGRIAVPEDYEILDATALGRRLGFKRDTVLAYLSRRNFRRIPRPNRQLAMGPIWYEKSVREWEAREQDARGQSRGGRLRANGNLCGHKGGRNQVRGQAYEGLSVVLQPQPGPLRGASAQRLQGWSDGWQGTA
jgi:hypothetical protein